MMEAALKRFAEQMAEAVEERRITHAGANSVLGQALLDAAGRGDVVPRWTRQRNLHRVRAALGQVDRVERAA